MKNYILLIFSIVYCQLLLAQPAEQKSKIPTLGEYKFVSIESIKSPFIATNLHMDLGLGQSGRFTTDGVSAGDSSILKLKGELLFVELKLGYQQSVKDWAGFFVNIDYAARLGSSAESIFVSGINTIIRIEPGVIFKLSESKKHMLSSYVKITNIKSSIVDLRQYLVDLLNKKKYASLTREVPALNAGAGLAFAYSFSPSFGINTDGQLVFGETLKRDQSKWQYAIGANATFNFHKVLKIPVALVVGGYANTITNAFSTEGELTSTFNMKLAYSGSESFILGLESYWGKTPFNEFGNRVQVNGFNFTSKFFF